MKRKTKIKLLTVSIVVGLIGFFYLCEEFPVIAAGITLFGMIVGLYIIIYKVFLNSDIFKEYE